MGYLIALFACVARLLCPAQGVHASPFGYLRELVFEARRRRSSRVRRYAVDLPTVVQDNDPCEVPANIPAPRKPADDLPHAGVYSPPRTTNAGLPQTAMSAVRPVMEPRAVQPQAALVRGFYVAFEREQAERFADRQRLGVTVLCDLAKSVDRKEPSA